MANGIGSRERNCQDIGNISTAKFFTFNGGYGYPPARPERVGWAQNGAEMVFDQADYGQALELE